MLSTRVTNDLAQQACIDAHIGNGLDRCMEARTIALRGKPPRTEGAPPTAPLAPPAPPVSTAIQSTEPPPPSAPPP